MGQGLQGTREVSFFCTAVVWVYSYLCKTIRIEILTVWILLSTGLHHGYGSTRTVHELHCCSVHM